MQQANAMLLLLLHSYEVGELSLSQYIAKQTAVNSKLQFFSSQTIKDFSDNLTAAVLDEPEDDEPFFHF